jgi:hypothetical protein
MANTASILTRVLLELMLDHYAKENGLLTAGDRDTKLESEIKSFREAAGRASVDIPRSVSRVLTRAVQNTPSLDAKLGVVIDHLIKTGKLASRDGEGKKREIRADAVVQLLHDALHRLDFVPSIDRITHLQAVIALIFNAMISE